MWKRLKGSVRQRVEVGLVPWAVTAVAAAILLITHPATGDLDRASILAIAGLVLAITAVTVGLVAVLAQHLAEAYARSLLEALFRQSSWRTTAIAEGVGVAVIVGLGLWRADITTGIAAGAILAASLIASWLALTHLFRQFDPLRLIHLQEAVALRRLQEESNKVAPARQPSQAILSLVLGAAAKGDTDVVSAGMAAWNTILERYVRVGSVTWYDDYLYWLYPRCEEVIEQHAKESVGLVLPTLVEGVAALGVTCAGHRNRVNPAFDEGTGLFTEALKNVVRLAGASRRSPAGQMAANGAAEIGKACIAASKFANLQAPIEALILIGTGTAENAVDIASRASVGLAGLLVELAESPSTDVMRRANAEKAVDGLRAIVARRTKGLGPGHFLVAPLSSVSVPRICQALALAPDDERRDHRRRGWDDLVASMAELCFDIVRLQGDNLIVGSNAVDAAGCVVVGLLAVEHRQSILETIERICVWLIDLTLSDEDRHDAPEILAAVCRATYQASDPPLGSGVLRALSATAAGRIAAAEPGLRLRLSPILRQVGAAAIHYGDSEMAEIMAKASLPEPPSLARHIHLDSDEFEVGIGLRSYLARPGVVVIPVPDYHSDPALQAAFLDLERKTDRSEGA